MSAIPPIGLLVVGMHRSGTSAVAGSLAQLGLPLGRHLLAAGDDNPKGYFEHEDAVRIDDALLDALDRRWDDPRALPADWMQAPAANDARQAISALLAREFSGMPLFALKDPRVCRVLPLWKDALRTAGIEPRVLLVVRHPSEVAASLRKRNGFSPALSLVLWLEHMLAAERDSRDCARSVIAYDDLVASPEEALASAIAALGLERFMGAVPSEPLSRFVSQADRHFAGGGDLATGSGFDDIANQALALLASQPLDTAAFDGLWKRYRARMADAGGLAEAIADVALRATRAVRAGEVEQARLQSALNAQLAWSEAAVAEREALQAALAEARSALAAQVAWSEGAVAEREALQAELADTRSALHAQVAWSEQAVVVREALQAEYEALEHALATERHRGDDLQSRLSRYEATLVGRLQRRWMAWRDGRAQLRKDTTR